MFQGALPKGEVYIGHRDAGFSIGNVSSRNSGDNGLEFTLTTPERVFALKAESTDDKNQWVTVLEDVISTPPTAADIRSKAYRCLYVITWDDCVNFLSIWIFMLTAVGNEQVDNWENFAIELK